MGPFAAFEDGPVLAQAIVDTVREPLLVLDKDLRVVAARRSFYETFQADRQETQGQLLYTLGDGQWDIPALRKLLEKTVPDEPILEGYEVEHEFPKIGRRTMLLNARTVISEKSAHTAGLGTSIVQALAKELDARVVSSATSTAPPCLSSTRARYRLLGPVTERSAYLCRLFIRCCNFTMG